jgi:hypothetical protein
LIHRRTMRLLPLRSGMRTAPGAAGSISDRHIPRYRIALHRAIPAGGASLGAQERKRQPPPRPLSSAVRFRHRCSLVLGKSRLACCPEDGFSTEGCEGRHTEGCGEEPPRSFGAAARRRRAPWGAEPPGKCCVPGRGHGQRNPGTQRQCSVHPLMIFGPLKGMDAFCNHRA